MRPLILFISHDWFIITNHEQQNCDTDYAERLPFFDFQRLRPTPNHCASQKDSALDYGTPLYYEGEDKMPEKFRLSFDCDLVVDVRRVEQRQPYVWIRA